MRSCSYVVSQHCLAHLVFKLCQVAPFHSICVSHFVHDAAMGMHLQASSSTKQEADPEAGQCQL